MLQEPKEFIEYKSDHDLLIELRTLVGQMMKKLEDFDANFVTHDEFWPVKVLVYGCTGLMLTGVITALLYLVIKS